MEPEALLIHADFVRSLARWLVKDEHLAEEIAQQTMLAALENPPADDKPLQAWLARVVRNFQKLAWRKESIRARHEEALAGTSYVRSTSEVIQLEEKRRAVVDAVLALDEPYRTVVLLRFYDDLPPRKIADRLDIPLDTVKSHIQRGKQKLKDLLDEKHGGDGKSWLASVVPLAGIGLLATTSRAAVYAAVAAAAMLTGVGLVVWQLWFAEAEPEATEIPAAVTAAAEEPPEAVDLPTVADASDEETEIVAASGQVFSGAVKDLVTGEPVTSYRAVLLKETEFGFANKGVTSEYVQDEGGRFVLPFDNDGRFVLRIESPRHRPYSLQNIEIDPGCGLTDLEIVLDPGLAVSGLVVDDVTGAPVAGAIVAPESARTLLEKRLRFGEIRNIHAFTDTRGRFVLSGLNGAGTAHRIVALHDDYSCGEAKVVPAREDPFAPAGEKAATIIRLRKGYRVSGRVLDDSGRPAEGVVVSLKGAGILISRPVVTGGDGRYRSAPFPPGEVWIVAAPPSKERDPEGSVAFTREAGRVLITDHDVTVGFGPADDHVTWRGVFHDRDGLAVSRGRIDINLIGPDPASGVLHRAITVCDEDGRFTFRKLSVGEYAVKLTYPGIRSSAQSEPVTLGRPGMIDLDLHGAGNRLSGRIIDEATGQPVRRGKVMMWPDDPRISGPVEFTAEPDAAGAFCIRGLWPGHYTLDCRAGLPVNGLLSSDRALGFSRAMNVSEMDVEIPAVRDVVAFEIVIPSAGMVHITGTGFDWSDRDALRLEFRRSADHAEPGKSVHPQVPAHFRSDGSWTILDQLEPGDWIASITVDHIGDLETAFTIEPHAVTEVILDRSNLVAYEGLVTVAGFLRGSDGIALADRRILFRPDETPGNASANRIRVRAETDAGGSYRAAGLFAGRWRVWLEGRGGYESKRGWNLFRLRLRDLEIPAGAPGIYLFDPVVPGGRITAELHDGRTGSPLTAGAARWSAHLEDAADGRLVCDYIMGGGAECAMEGIPQGSYRLVIGVDGYARYESEVFFLRRGETLPFGRVMLDRTVSLFLELHDSAGNSLPDTVLVNVIDAETGRRFTGFDLPGGGYLFEVPDATFNLQIEANGFEKRIVEVKPIAGETNRVRVQLSSE